MQRCGGTVYLQASTDVQWRSHHGVSSTVSRFSCNVKHLTYGINLIHCPWRFHWRSSIHTFVVKDFTEGHIYPWRYHWRSNICPWRFHLKSSFDFDRPLCRTRPLPATNQVTVHSSSRAAQLPGPLAEHPDPAVPALSSLCPRCRHSAMVGEVGLWSQVSVLISCECGVQVFQCQMHFRTIFISEKFSSFALGGDVPLVQFTYLVLTQLPGALP